MQPGRKAAGITGSSLWPEYDAKRESVRRVLRKVYMSIARRLVLAVVFLPAVSFAGPTHGQRVIIMRFLDYRSAKPLKNLYVSVTFWNGKNPKDVALPRNVVSRNTLKTDQHGKISISVPEQVPEHIYIMASDFFFNNPSMISTAEVLKSGLLLPYPGKQQGKHPRHNPHLSAKPGEIIVLNKRMTAWDRILQEIP